MEGDGQLDMEMGGDIDGLDALSQDIVAGDERRRRDRLWCFGWDDVRGGRYMRRCRSMAGITRNQSRNDEEHDKCHRM